MKAKTLTTITGAVVLAGSAALYAMSFEVDASAEGAGHAGRLLRPGAAPAFNVVVTSRRATPGHSYSGARRRPDSRHSEWTSATATGHGWGEAAPDHRS
jgi:hypothetical protein